MSRAKGQAAAVLPTLLSALRPPSISLNEVSMAPQVPA